MSLIKHIAVVIACAGACQAFTQEPQPDPRTISVTGTAVTQVKPDYAVVEIEAFYKAGTAVEAKKKCDAAMARAIAAIRKLGVKAESITTTGYSVFPAKNKEGTILSWKVAESASIKIRKPAMAADVIDAAVANGAPIVSGIQFGLDAVGPARDQVRALAVKTARDKAEALAKLTGVELGPVLSIAEQGDYGYYGQNYNSGVPAGGYMAGMAGEAPISAGQSTVSLTVVVVYAIK